MRVVFFGVMAMSTGWPVWQIWSRASLWRKGQRGGFEQNWRVRIQRLIIYALAQKRVHRKPLGALLHLLLFSGFVVLTIGTTLWQSLTTAHTTFTTAGTIRSMS